MDVDCSNLVDLLAVILRNQHLGGSLLGDKMLRGVGWWAWCIEKLAGAGTLSRSGMAAMIERSSQFFGVCKNPTRVA